MRNLMTPRIPQSQVKVSADEFHRLVEGHIGELKAWTAHMGRVRLWELHKQAVDRGEQVKRPAPVEHHRYPPPRASPLIEASVKVDSVGDGQEVSYAPDYEIFDDGPSLEEILRQKKDALMPAVYEAERKEIHVVIPFAKHRAAAIRNIDLVGKTEKTPEDDAEIVDYQVKMQQIEAITRKYAKILSDIEDLTPQNIDTYRMET
jgi:hypothetical protein